jgi:hypothetical protein
MLEWNLKSTKNQEVGDKKTYKTVPDHKEYCMLLSLLRKTDTGGKGLSNRAFEETWRGGNGGGGRRERQHSPLIEG